MKKYIGLLTILFLLYSCKSADQIAYFQDIDKLIADNSIATNTHFDTKIQPDDLLAITVSGQDPQAVAIFNLPLTSYMKPGETSVSTTPVIQSYLVDSDGNIDFPVLGKVQTAGLTRTELTDYLKAKISNYSKTPIVTVRILNYKISVIGEVNRPGTITLPGERVTILDALSMAGDLTIYGERSNILLIREIDGMKEAHRFDLTSSDVLISPYYYLKQNDVIYVEPNQARKGNSKYNQSSQFNISVVSTIVGAISVIASLAIALWIK